MKNTLAWVLGVVAAIFLCGFLTAGSVAAWGWLRPLEVRTETVVETVEVQVPGPVVTVEKTVIETVEIPVLVTPQTPASTPAPSQCISRHVGADKPFSFVAEAGMYYHVNFVTGTGDTGEANVVFLANSASEVTIPEGSVWEYPSLCSFTELKIQTTRDSLDDEWPSEAPNWLPADADLIDVR